MIVAHTGFTVANYHSTYVFGLLFPLGAGMLFFGWRAAAVVSVVVITAWVATAVWRRIGTRGHAIRPAQMLRLALLLALMMPARLAANPPARQWAAEWPVLPAAAVLLVIVCWLVGPGGGGRLHMVVFAYLVLAALFPKPFQAQTVLQRNRVGFGDVLRRDGPVNAYASPYAWRQRPLAPPPADALACPSTGDALLAFTVGHSPPDVTSVDALLRTRLPSLEDIVLGATPGPIGTTSGVAVIIGGLFLLYRGLIDFRVPLLIVMTAWLALLVLPIDLPTGSGTHRWQWLAGASSDVGWATGVTFANYEALASPLLFTAFFLAGSPSVRPLGRPARSVYAVLIGLSAAALQLYVSVELGSYIAVFVVGLIASDLDRWLGARPLVGRP